MTNFIIKIVSDPVCPFCYLGKKRLDRGIELFKKVYPGAKDDTFTVSWSAFYLDPTAPKIGIPVKERMEQRFGKKSLDFQESLKKMGREDGINFNIEGKIGNTRDSHRLIQLGKTKGNQVEDRVVMELFRSYFEEAGDITSHAMLIDVGGKAGLDREEARQWLAEGKGGQEVDAEVEEANAKGIHGVPSFTIQGKYEVDGAQPPEAFFQALVDAKEGK